jgi:hypothetical protein
MTLTFAPPFVCITVCKSGEILLLRRVAGAALTDIWLWMNSAEHSERRTTQEVRRFRVGGIMRFWVLSGFKKNSLPPP